MSQRTLKSLYCERFECPASAYEEEVFKRLLYGHARWLGALLRLLHPNFFADDFHFIARLGEAVNLLEAQSESGRFHDVTRARSSFLRNWLKLRVSGRKAVALASQLFSQANVASAAASSQRTLH